MPFVFSKTYLVKTGRRIMLLCLHKLMLFLKFFLILEYLLHSIICKGQKNTNISLDNMTENTLVEHLITRNCVRTRMNKVLSLKMANILLSVSINLFLKGRIISQIGDPLPIFILVHNILGSTCITNAAKLPDNTTTPFNLF